MQKLPGSTPKIHKPHPPSKIAPPGIRSRLVHIRRGENAAPHHNRIMNGYMDEQGHPHLENSSRNNRNLARNGLSHGSEVSEDRSSNEDDRGSLQRYEKV